MGPEKSTDDALLYTSSFFENREQCNHFLNLSFEMPYNFFISILKQTISNPGLLKFNWSGNIQNQKVLNDSNPEPEPDQILGELSNLKLVTLHCGLWIRNEL